MLCVFVLVFAAALNLAMTDPVDPVDVFLGGKAEDGVDVCCCCI